MTTEIKEGFFSNLPRKPFFLNFLIWVQIIGFVLGSLSALPKLFTNFSISNLLMWLLSLALFISVLGLMKLKKWGLYSYLILLVINFIIWSTLIHGLLYLNSLSVVSLAIGSIWLLIVLIYLFCVRKWFDSDKRPTLKARKPVKTIFVVIGVIASIVIAIIVLFLTMFFYSMSHPNFAQKLGQNLFEQQFTLLCKTQPKEKQSRCFALAAGTLENNALCDQAPNKNECINAIGKVDAKEFDTKK